MLEQDQRGGRIVRDVLEDIPRVVVGEHVDAVRRRLGARLRARDHPFLALDPEADQRADLAAELDRLILGEVAQVRDLDLAVRVLVHRERVDDAHGVAFPQALQLGDDLAVELRMVEAEHNECTGPMAIVPPSGRAGTAVDVIILASVSRDGAPDVVRTG